MYEIAPNAGAPNSPNLYYDSAFDLEAAKILPGEFYVTKRDMVLVTVLGSCVAACIRDRSNGIGGMNHFMLPDSPDEAGVPTSVATRYGAHAMEMMINQLLKIGAERSRLEAKVFGGASILRGMPAANIGMRNAQFAINYLQDENIAIISKDLLDIYPRKVYFFPANGRVLVKKIRSMHNETILEREQAYRNRLKEGDIQGEVDLF